MKIELTPQQQKDRATFRAFVDAEIVPHANQFDRDERVPQGLIGKIAEQGYLGAILPQRGAERGMDMITFGLLNEEFGRGCSSLRSLLTVHNMVAHALQRWGSRTQKDYWLPRLASGEVVAAFCLSEPNVGSDAASVETTATPSGDSFVLNGRKKWITFGQIADLFLVFGQCEGKSAAFIVEKERRGLTVKPIGGMLGVRASMLAEVHLDDCLVPKENLVARVGFGFSHVAASALDYGRYSVAWGCVGIAQACLEASLAYADTRKQFGVYLKEQQLIRQMLTEMITNVKAARLLCLQAGYLKETGDPQSLMETSIAKYFASTTATKAASDAVQIHGANGCSADYPVERFWRDAKIMEIIEGSTQMQQLTIAQFAYQEHRR
ncbi:MAG TPA: acyl-CoA dehydrogenase family protein [Pyrinomonadaceae bacterium]|jgi:hypothetical protein